MLKKKSYNDKIFFFKKKKKIRNCRDNRLVFELLLLAGSLLRLESLLGFFLFRSEDVDVVGRNMLDVYKRTQ